MALAGKIVCGSFDVEINGAKAARKTDLTDHAGVISQGCSTVLVNGAAFVASRVADAITCPSPEDGGHVGGTILGPGSTISAAMSADASGLSDSVWMTTWTSL